MEKSNGFFSTSLACYIFLLSSLLNEFLGAYAGIHFPLVAVSFAIIFVLYLSANNAFRFFRTPFVIPWLALLAWWILAGILGDYPGRSLGYLWGYALRLHTLPLIICGIALDLRGLRKVMFGAAFGVIAVLAFCVKFGEAVEDRFIIPETSLANANDLALRLLLYGAMFLVFFGAGRLGKLLGAVTLPVLAYYVLRTGSRASELTLVLLVLVSLFLLPSRKKIWIVVVAIIVPLCSLPFLPQQTLGRLSTFFEAKQGATALQGNAVDSTNARLQLQERAIRLTAEHMVFGVGPLMFQDAVEKLVREELGVKSGWQVAHNSYLQVSAETGLPGLIFYAWNIILCLVLNHRSFRKSTGNHNLVSFSLFLASIVYAVGVFFCSIPYDYYLALLVGLTASNYLAFQPEEPAPDQNGSGGQGNVRMLPQRPVLYRGA